MSFLFDATQYQDQPAQTNAVDLREQQMYEQAVQQQASSQSYMSGMNPAMMRNREADETFMRWHHDTSDILEILEFQMRGFEKKFGEWIIPKDNKPTINALMNERGIYDIMQICRTNFSKITNSTNLDSNEVSEMAIFFEFSIIDALQSHYIEYAIKQPQDLNVVYSLVRNPYFAMLKQSYLNGTRTHIGNVMSYTEGFRNMDRDAMMSNQGMMPRKKFLGIF